MRNIPIRKGFLVLAILFFSIVLLVFIFRDILVTSYLSKKIEHFNEDHHAGLSIERIEVQWLASLRMTGITIKPDHADPFLQIDTAYVSVNGWKLLAGRLAIQDLVLKNITCSFTRNGNETNYDFLVKTKEQQADSPNQPVNFAYAVNRLTGFVFDKIPNRVEIQNLKIAYNSDGHSLSLSVDRFSVRDRFFRIPLSVTENDTARPLVLQGMIDREDRLASMKLFRCDTGKSYLPFLRYKWNALAGFDTVFLSFSEKEINDSLSCITGRIRVRGFELQHARISSKKVLLDRLDVSYTLNIGKDYAEIDSATSVVVNTLDLHPYIRYRTGSSKQITIRLDKPSFKAQELFSSLPPGLFTNLDGIQVTGEFSYHFDFFVDLSMPDSLHFMSELKQRSFRVISYGGNDLTKLNGSFLYTAFEKGVPVRTFTVGPENPDFRPLERISPFLRFSVLTSEDPGFFQHRGFIPDAFRESVIADIKERKFARGGSTISMQLVKNVFLSRNKTIARKLEEILLTWLIENQGLSTKERMFEVYLNIIEWGPLIYGANEAARFYFNKDASKLNLAESVFLASIIPRPKWFKYSFDDTGHLRESQAGYYKLLSEKMLNKGWITQHDFDKLVPDVDLRGPAKLLLKKSDPIPADTVAYPE